jgi:hypothetical protein
MLYGRPLSRGAALLIAATLLGTAPALAQLGSSCTPGGTTGTGGGWSADSTGNNWYCNSGTDTVTYPAYQFGATALACSSTGAGMVQWTGSAFQGCNGASWGPVDASTSVALSSLTAATTGNTIDSGANAQVWNWNSLGTGTALTISSTSMTTGTLLSLQDTAIAATSTGKVLNISDTTTGAGYGVYSAMTGAGNTGFALYGTTSTTGAGTGVYGSIVGTGNTGYGVYGSNASNSGYAVYASGALASTGTATAASFIPTGSTAPSNGMYYPAANSLAFSTSGSTALTISTTGYVGIGTAAPSVLLTVKGAGSSGTAIGSFLPGSGSSYTRINDNGTMALNADGSSGATPLDVLYNGSEEFTFSYTGVLSLNNGNPNGNAASIGFNDGEASITTAGAGSWPNRVLTLNTYGGNIQIIPGGLSGYAKSLIVKPAADLTTVFQVQNAAGTTTILDVDSSNGRVGIGTTSPANKLDVNGGVAIGSYAGSAGIANGLVISGSVGLGTNSATTGYELTASGGLYSLQNSTTYAAAYVMNTTTTGTASTGAGAALYASATGASNTADALYATNSSGTGYAIYANGRTYLNGTTTVSGNLVVTGSCTGCVATGSNALSALTSAQSSNSFDNAAYAQTWTWNTLSTGTALTISSTSMTTGSLLSLQDTAIAGTSTGEVLSVSDTTTGAGYGVYSAMTGAGNTGFALYGTTSTTGAGTGVYGSIVGTGNTGYGVYGSNASNSGYAVYASGALASTGTATAASFIPTGSTAPSNGMYYPAANSLAFSTSGSTALTISTTGYVGIGTIAPPYILDIEGSDSTSPTAWLQNDSSTISRFPRFSVMNYKGAVNGSPGFNTYTSRGSSASPSPVLSGDNLGAWGGFGQYDTTEGDTLKAAQINFYADQNFSSSAAGGAIAFLTTTSGTTTNTERMRINSLGNVGIGTATPADMLDVNGAIGLTTTTATLPVNGVYSPAANKLALTTSGATAMTITTTGAVGIGTTSPQATLDVSGYTRLAKNSSQPVACSSTNDGAIALTALYTLCICNGGSSTWVQESNGTTTCSW